MLNTDNLISLHKVTEDVISKTQMTKQALDVANTNGYVPDETEVNELLLGLNNAVEALAVVQRDLLADHIEALARFMEQRPDTD